MSADSRARRTGLDSRGSGLNWAAAHAAPRLSTRARPVDVRPVQLRTPEMTRSTFARPWPWRTRSRRVAAGLGSSILRVLREGGRPGRRAPTLVSRPDDQFEKARRAA